jgi:molecular chaperone GrpE
MGEETKDPSAVDGDRDEEIEIEFVDEGTPAESPPQPAPRRGGESGLEPVDLGPSVEVEIERLESELDELRDIHLRKLAEFDNFRKRTEREREDFRRLASEDLIRELLPVLDNFERALQHGTDADFGAFRDGVVMIARQLWDTLERQGVQAIDPLGKPFSPEVHEAVHQVEDSDLEPGTVAMVLAKGYLLNGRLLRPAMVGVVAARPQGSREAPAGDPSGPGTGGVDG